MTKTTKYVDYFPCITSSLRILSSSLSSSSSSSSSSDSSDDDDVDVDVGSSKNHKISRRVRVRVRGMNKKGKGVDDMDSSDDDDDDDDDVRPSKIPKISGRDTAVVDKLLSSSDEEEFISSDSSSSASFNLWSDASDDEEKQALLSEMDEYIISPNVNMRGKKVDLISYLSSKSRDFLVDKNGGKVSVKSSIEGKYVILIWVKLPVSSWRVEGYTCWALQSACSNWSTTNVQVQVQVVVVPSTSPGWEDEAALASFLSGLPSCLAIPLWDSNSASYSCVWDYYRITASNSDHPYTIVFDPNQTVLQQDCCYSIIHYGADSYPFTDERFLTLNKTSRELLQEKPFPLERLLGLDLSDCLSNVAGDANITVSELKQKLVGVFVTFNFHIFDAINQAYQDCLAKGRELEIVLACINLVDDPQHYMDSVYAALRDNDKAKGILSSWWVLPYNDSTQRRLWKLCDNFHYGEDECKEELIIVGPQGQFFDPQTLYAISRDPIHDMYPYAIQAIAQQETARLQKLTLESLLISTTHNNDDYLVTQQGNLMPVTELRGKNVLLFIADLKEGFDEIMDRMRDYWCPEIKDKCKVSNTAVVFVPLHSSELIFTKDLDPRMFWLWDPTISWLISPPNHVREALIIKDLSLKGKGLELDLLSCVAFGEDGQFVSKDLYDLSEYMANDFPPDHLYYHVLQQYCLLFDKELRTCLYLN